MLRLDIKHHHHRQKYVKLTMWGGKCVNSLNCSNYSTAYMYIKSTYCIP